MIVHAQVTDEVRIVDGERVASATGKEWLRMKDSHTELLRVCESVLAWATAECMPQGGRYDGPWEAIELAVARYKGA